MPDCAIIGGGPVGLVFAILNHASKVKIQIFGPLFQVEG